MAMANSGYARGRLAPVALWSLALLLPAWSLACYNPTITDAGLQCADAGKACPDGFECDATDHKCHATVKCSTPAVTPLCQDAAKAGAMCNPTCQVGCACGRCNVVGASPICSTSVGTVKLGQVCTPGNKDNCEPGFICLLESCGTNLGRCYQHCTTTAQCGTGRTCEIPILDGTTGRDTGYRTCSLQTQPCNPVAAAAANGCPSASLTCFLNTDGTSFCDCPNDPPAILGAVCSVYNDCGTGLVCTPSANSAGTHCRQACTVANSACANGQRCVPEGATYGYCGGN